MERVHQKLCNRRSESTQPLAFQADTELLEYICNENEKDAVLNSKGLPVPFIDPHTDAYRPGTRAMNYRSEPFYNRLELAPLQEAHAYGSYTFGDPATPMPRAAASTS